MANTIITPTVIAKRALATLYNEVIFAGLVHRDFDSEFTGKQGDTVTVRTPATFTANEFDRNAGIQIQNITEGSISVALDKIADVSVAVTAEELTLEMDDFDNRVLTPMSEAIAQKIDVALAEKLIDTAEGAGGGGTITTGTSTPSALFTGETGAVAKLGRANAPENNRYAVFSPEASGVALGQSLFVEADKSGSTDGLRNASVGRVFGFETFRSNQLGFGGGDAGQADGVAFHRDAVTLVSRTLQAPEGLPSNQVAVESYKGLGLRVTKSYDITYKQDVISVDFLYGVQDIDGREKFAIQLSLGLGS